MSDNYRIFIVEDNPLNAELAIKLLEGLARSFLVMELISAICWRRILSSMPA